MQDDKKSKEKIILYIFSISILIIGLLLVLFNTNKIITVIGILLIVIFVILIPSIIYSIFKDRF